MSGGAAMRAAAAAKVAGVGVIKSGIRGGVSVVSSLVGHMRNVSRPVSAILSSSQSRVDCSEVQRQAIEPDGWESAGVKDEPFIESSERMPRVVFEARPSQKEAITDLKDALENVYMSSHSNMRSDGSYGSMLTNSDDLETKGCITDYPRATTSPNYAMTALDLLKKSSELQNIVAAIASDPNVWDAVKKNPVLQEFLHSQKTGTADEASQTETAESKPVSWFENVKQVVTELVKDPTSIVQRVFGFPTAENKSSADGGHSEPSCFHTKAASFLALAVMTIVFVLKR